MYLFYRAVCCFPARARAVLLRLLWCVPRLLAPLAFSLPPSLIRFRPSSAYRPVGPFHPSEQPE